VTGVGNRPTRTPRPWTTSWDALDALDCTTGSCSPHVDVYRGNACASQKKVLGYFGAGQYALGKPGFVRYAVSVPQAGNLYLRIRYSKHSDACCAIDIYVDDELRASFTPGSTGDWNRFACWRGSLGAVAGGAHTLTLVTQGQTYGVADLDVFSATNLADTGSSCACR
jgi:hypothetical protein